MRILDRLTAEYLSGALELLGSCALIGVNADKADVRWPRITQVHEAMSFIPPRPGSTTIGYIQVQLWLGLREMARLRPDRVMVPATASKQILTLWKNSTGYNDKQQALNDWMIDWLERCARSNWLLVPDQTPLAQFAKQT
jgi:hypothetical protein